MRRPPRHWYAVAVALLAVQVSVSALGTIGLCVDRQHTHGGVPAPDCLMHQQMQGTEPESSSHGHHHHQDGGSSTGTARLGCSCSADPLTLLTTEIAVTPGTVGIPLPNIVPASTPERASSAADMRPAPLSPPPRPSLS
jgi:hypothetical protein